jgi:transcriptional regulator NrdR family protein
MKESTLANHNHVVHRAGNTEAYDERKLYASIYSALLAVKEPSGSAELIAERVCRDVAGWLSDKHEITSGDIKRHAYKFFRLLHPDAAKIYLKQRKFGRK